MFTKRAIAEMPPFRLVLNVLAILVLSAPFLIAAAGLLHLGHRWPDILAQFVAPAFWLTLLFLAIVALARLWPATVVAGVTALLLLIAAWPQWTPPKGEAAENAPILRLYSANLWARNEDIDAIVASIQKADADVVVLIELGDTPAVQLDRILAGYPHRQVTPRVDRPSGAARSVIASRFPLTLVKDRDDGLHAVTAVADTPIGAVNIVGVHLTRPWPFQYQWGQITQVMALTERLKDLNGPIIVAGDFNSVSSARIGRQVQRDTGLIPAPGLPGTWPSPAPGALRMTIDQVYRSSDLALIQRRLGAPTGSDHRPVITEFSPAATD